MNVIGDLERFFATSLYPLRVPIAIAVAAAFVVIVVIARRRGWIAAARRHPRRSGTALAALMVIGLPVAWLRQICAFSSHETGPLPQAGSATGLSSFEHAISNSVPANVRESRAS